MRVVAAKGMADFMRNHQRVPDDLRVGSRKTAFYASAHSIGQTGPVQGVQVGYAAVFFSGAEQMDMVAWLPGAGRLVLERNHPDWQ